MSINNVIRLLTSKNIPFEIYELPKEKLGAEETSDYLKIPLKEVYKSIIVKREIKGKAIIAIAPGDKEVNLKLLAKAIGEKKVILPTEKEAEALTGLQTGGISPLALLNRGYQVVIDQSVRNLDRINISAGERGLNIRIPVSNLIELTAGKIADITGK